MEYTIPAGRNQGQFITDASEKDLEYWIRRKDEDLCKDPDGRFAASNKRWLDAARAELDRRADPAGSTGDSYSAEMVAEPRSASTAISRTGEASVLELVGSYSDPLTLNRALRTCAEQCHLISPAPMVAHVPEGCEVMLTAVRIAASDDHLYSVGNGKVALDKTHLVQLLNAMHGSIAFSRRVDDRSHPHHCEAEVGIQYHNFDGSTVIRSARAEMDLREPHGPRYVATVEAARAKDRDPSGELLQQRKFIWRHTEGRALAGAIANIGIRRSYERHELAKPFVVAGLMFTGHSPDPEIQRENRRAIRESFLGSARQMFAAPPAPIPNQSPDDEGIL